MQKSTTKLPIQLKLGYGFADSGLNIFFATTGLLLVPYMVTVLGLSLQTASWVILIPKLWDMVTDPMMGTISDHTRSRWGRRRPFLLAGSILFSLSFVLLFSTPSYGSQTTTAIHLGAMFILCATCFTVFQVPYGAMTAEMTSDYDERTSLTAYRQFFASVGILAAGGAGPLLVAAGNGGRDGYRFMAIVLAGFSFVALFTCFVATARAPRLEQTSTRVPLLQQFKLCLKNRPFVILASTYMVQTLAASGLMSMIGLVALYTLGAENTELATSIITASLLFSAMLGMPFWAFLSSKLGKKRCYMIGGTWFGIFIASLIFIGSGDLLLTSSLAALAGFGMTSFQLFPWSMLPDTIDHDTLKSGQRREGIYNGMWTAAQKLSLAVGPWFLMQILGGLGFKASTEGNAVNQPEIALTGLKLCFSIIPALIFLGGLFILRFYPLTSSRMREIHREAALAASRTPSDP